MPADTVDRPKQVQLHANDLTRTRNLAASISASASRTKGLLYTGLITVSAMSEAETELLSLAREALNLLHLLGALKPEPQQ